MDHDSIIEMMMETIKEREDAIHASSKARGDYEKSEFYDGFNIIEVTEEEMEAA